MASEIEELRAKAIASMASTGNPNSRLKKIAGGAKEEGEVSSSSDEKAASPNSGEPASVAETIAVSVPVAKARNISVQNVSRPRPSSSVTGKSFFGNAPANRTFLSRPMQQHYHWRAESNLIPSKSTISQTHGRPMVARNSDNLVIRFSDDDSQSDSDELQENDRSRSLHRDQPKHAAMSRQVRLSTSQQKKVPNKTSTTMTTLHGASSNAHKNSAEWSLQSQRQHIPSKTSTSPDCVGMRSNERELETLRQQIATKENELRQQNVQPKTKEKASAAVHSCIIKDDIRENVVGGPSLLDGSTPNADNKKYFNHEQPHDIDHQSEAQKRMLISAMKPILRRETKDQEHSAHQADSALKDSVLSVGKECSRKASGNNKRSISDTTYDSFKNGNAGQRHKLYHSSSGGIPCTAKKPRLLDAALETNKHNYSPMIRSTSEDGPKSLAEDRIHNDTRCAEKALRCVDYNVVACGGKISQGVHQQVSKPAVPLGNELTTYDVQLGDFGQGCMDFQYLMEIEEVHDRELEEAQELRRKCEMEERSALRAYRKAQRALMDANERCAFLYRRRELLSVQLQASLMKDHCLWLSDCHKQKNMIDNMDSVTNLPGGVPKGLPYIWSQTHGDCDQIQGKTNLNNKSVANLRGSVSCQEMTCCNPDGGTTQLSHGYAVDVRGSSVRSDSDAACTHLNNMDACVGEDEQTFPDDCQAVTYGLSSEKGGMVGLRVSNADGAAKQISNVDDSFPDSAQNYSLLEASLRSKLFSRLKMRPSLASNSPCSDSDNFVGEDGEDVQNRFTEISFSRHVTPRTGQKEGSAQPPVRSLANTIDPCTQVGISCVDNAALQEFDTTVKCNDHEECSSSLGESGGSPLASASFAPSATLDLVLRHKDMLSKSLDGSYNTDEHNMDLIQDQDFGNNFSVSRHEFFSLPVTFSITNEKREKPNNMGHIFKIDPFWPLCMFELRGKCNDRQCAYQHVRDYTHTAQELFGVSEVPVNQLSLQRPTSTFLDFHCNTISIPTYLVGSEFGEVDGRSFGDVLAQKTWHYWDTFFCSSFTLPFSVHRALPPALPSFHNRGDFDDDGSRNRWSLCIGHGQDHTMNQLVDGLVDPEKSLEIVLGLQGRRVYTLEGRKKALVTLSCALEANPNSVALWVVYLHIFYKPENNIGKDDMFLHGMHRTEYSYELCLLFINSRLKIGERVKAYETVLSKLCHRVHVDEQDNKYASGCILDIFLQYMNFLCISGYTETAVSRIGELYNNEVEGCNHISILYIISCLVVHDRFILWVSCLYLVVYGKLPDPIVGCFEFHQQMPFGIEWPAIQLTGVVKDKALQLVSVVEDKLRVAPDDGLVKQEECHIRSKQALVVNLIKCTATLKGIKCALRLTEEYRNIYPTCIELLVMSMNIRRHCEGDVDLAAFEDSLQNWPKGTPGIECAWNQYLGHALTQKGTPSVKDLLSGKWFPTVSSDAMSDREVLQVDQNGKFSPQAPNSSGQSVACLYNNPKDEAYWLLNYALYKLLNGDKAGAQSAVDKSILVASSEDFNHLAGEHAVFSLSNPSDLAKSLFDDKLLTLLCSYLTAANSFSSSQPLSRNFLSSIKKPRLQQLIGDIIGPVSLDCSVLNSVLEYLYGPSLLPDANGNFKVLMDFVESLMDLRPANYSLALSLCKSVSQIHDPHNMSSISLLFWSCSLLANSVLQAFPPAPEKIWVEAIEILRMLGVDVILERFHQQALCVFPFSVSLWRSYLDLRKQVGDTSTVIEAAKRRGIDLST